MTPRDLPETARPWTDTLGNVWCVTARGADPVLYELVTIQTIGIPGQEAFREEWREVTFFAPRCAVPLLHPDLLAGLGRTLPPVPTPKRVAKAVPMGIFEYAVKGNTLYDRMKGVRGLWEEWKVCTGLGEPLSRLHVAAAHEAFQHAGDVLPGEEAE